MNPAAFAPAKVNLYLHVGPLRSDGYHPVSTLMVFADIGDRLTLEPANQFAMAVSGPFAAAVPADKSNLVMRAARALLAKVNVAAPALRLTLDKQLPVAAGLGGGSSDAAAALRLLRDQLSLEIADEELEAIGAGIGSDVPACVRARAVIGEGRGEVLRPAPALAPISAVLFDPGVPSSTPAVYRAFDASGAMTSANTPAMPDDLAATDNLVAFLETTRNDLEVPAIALQPSIGEGLKRLRSAPETLFARMSGSGSSCFAICADDGRAAALAARFPNARACRFF